MKLLLVEDNLGDVGLIREAFASCQAEVEIRVARDGIDALEKLDRAAHADRPDLILLDLNLPRRHGREVLEEIKSDPQLMHIPVVILTSSQAEEDILRSYQSHANCFITKPVDLEQLTKVVQGIEQFWFTLVKLPSES